MTDVIVKIDKYFDKQLNEDINILMETAYFAESEELNEEVGDIVSGLKNLLSKMGIEAHETSKGIIHILASAGKTMTQFFYHALRAPKNKESRKKVKEIAGKEITKEEIIDFLLKLDVLTLHLLTGPIHMIEALTGWHIWAKVGKKSQEVMDRARKALEVLKDHVQTLTGKAKKKANNLINKLKDMLGINT